MSVRGAREKSDRKKAERIIAENRKAHHDYHLLETFEAGMALVGTEVKAIREGRVNLRDSYAKIEGGTSTSTTSTSGPTAAAATRTTSRSGRAGCSCTGTRSGSSSARRPSAA